MNENAEKLLNVILDDALNVREFVIDKAPVVVQQILAWNFWSSILCTLVPILLFVGVYVASKMTKFWDHKNIFYDNPGKILTSWAMFLIAVIGLFIAACNIDWLQILIAPDLYLMEYARGLK